MDAAEDVDICELVNGFDVQIGDEGEVSGFYIQALKNNNGAGILLLPDIFGWESSATRDIANQLGCFGYKYDSHTFLHFISTLNPLDSRQSAQNMT